MRVPTATYRIQFQASFGFKEALEVVDYLRDLGVSDLYASPVFTAGKGSNHGYDVIDPLEVNPELGGRAGLEALSVALRERSMGWVQDIVPNHMAVASGNRFLMDVLENGPNSRYYDFFDIDWDHPYETIKGRLLMPFLGRLYGECLEAGELVLRYGEEGLTVGYYDFRFPLRIESYAHIFGGVSGNLRRDLGRDHPDYIKLLGILYVLKTLPGGEALETQEGAPGGWGERSDQIAFVKRVLWELYTDNTAIRRAVDQAVLTTNGEPGRPESFNELDCLLSEQHFKLAFWKVATQEINYRRFFNINGLICLRAEKEQVFGKTHGLILDLVREGTFTGLRVDHIDGLLDPAAYLRRLRDRAPEAYIVVEKILAADERLPADWPVQGTTGYDFILFLAGVTRDPTVERSLTRFYEAFTRLRTGYQDLVYEKKRLIIEKDMAGDVEDLAFHIQAIAARDRMGSDITLNGLRKGLVELLALFPVYRTYISRDSLRPTDRDYVRHAVRGARRLHPDLLYELAFLERFLLLEFGQGETEEGRRTWARYAMRFQQLSGPLMAKGFEDTTLYVYNRLLSQNEVGGDPGQLEKAGGPADRWHDFCAERAANWPHAMNASSTHDTKRGEDVRARLDVLTEMTPAWERQVAVWSKENRRLKQGVNGQPVPDANDEYFLYQTLIGVLPPGELDRGSLSAFRDRIKEYIIKAVREAKVHTEWIKPDAEYEEAYLQFIDNLLDPDKEDGFLGGLASFGARVAFHGMLNSLTQTLLKIGAPGVPDVYQGSELWNLSLVDPDNRRPVDFQVRAAMLGELKKAEASGGPDLRGLLDDWPSGRAKLWLLYTGLRSRKERPELFGRGAYIPLRVTGRQADHVVAFARRNPGPGADRAETRAGQRTDLRGGEGWAVCAAPVLTIGLAGEGRLPLGRPVWEDTRIILPDGAPARFMNAVTGADVSGPDGLYAAELFESFPAALLLSRPGPGAAE